MSRPPRKFSESGIYHIMFRGSNKQSIFLDKWDYIKFLELLKKVKEKMGFELYAYCLMTNHVHLIIKEKNERDISETMKRLLGEYVVWFNLKYDRTGVLMENRYKSQAVEKDEYFLHVIRYVHQNPLKAGIVKQIDEYEWSSYRDYISKTEGLTDIAFLGEMMNKNQFIEFHATEEDNDFELFPKGKKTDEDLIEELKRLGIEELSALKYSPPDKQQRVFNELKKNFSARHIERVTRISRKNYKN